MGENGVRGTSFTSIAEFAHVGKPSVYLRWPNYTSILVAVIADMETPVEPLLKGTLSDRLLHALEDDWVFFTDSERVGFIRAVLAAGDSSPECATELQTRILGPRRDRLVSVLRGRGRPTPARAQLIEAAADHLQAPLLHAVACRGLAPSYGGLSNVVGVIINGIRDHLPSDDAASSLET